MAEVILTLESRACLKIALGLRRTELLLQMIVDGALPVAEQTEATFGIRQEQLLYLATLFERAVKDQAPELPPRERPKAKTKLVWCSRPGCSRTLAKDERKISDVCVVCRLEDEKKAAAT